MAAFPIGIDPERFTSALETDIVKAHMADLRERFAGRKVMLGVDRLDMIKGIPQKLLAYEMFLDENPEWCDKVRESPLSWKGHHLQHASHRTRSLVLSCPFHHH